MSDDLTIPRPGYRHPRHSQPVIDPGTKRLLMIAGGLAGGLVLIFAASGMIGHHSGALPVVQADPGPIRVKPENPGGLQVANANNEIFSGDDTGGSKLAPPPEVPDPAALRDQPVAPPAPAPHAQAAPMIAAPPPPPPPAPQSRVAQAVPESPAARIARAVVPPPAAKLASVQPAARVAAQPVEKAPPAARVAAQQTEKAPPAAGKSAVVQLAALGSEDAARAEWQQLAKRMPELLGSHQPAYSRFEHDGHTYWRLRTAGFADVAQARTFCQHVKAKGVSCSLADF